MVLPLQHPRIALEQFGYSFFDLIARNGYLIVNGYRGYKLGDRKRLIFVFGDQERSNIQAGDIHSVVVAMVVGI